MLKDHENVLAAGMIIAFCFCAVTSVGVMNAYATSEGKETPAMGNSPSEALLGENSVELLPADPKAKPLVPGRTYSLKELSKNTVAEEREFFTNAYLVLCAPASCPPCPEGVVCAPCVESVLYFADQPLKGKTEAELKAMREVLVGHHYEFCPELSKYKSGKRHRLKVAIQNMSPEEGLVYNDMRIVEPE
jgi:hypothetical protein